MTIDELYEIYALIKEYEQTDACAYNMSEQDCIKCLGYLSKEIIVKENER